MMFLIVRQTEEGPFTSGKVLIPLVGTSIADIPIAARYKKNAFERHLQRRENFNKRHTNRQIALFASIWRMRSIILLEYPHSLSYQLITLTELPITLVHCASMIEEWASP